MGKREDTVLYQLTFIITFALISLLTVKKSAKIRTAADFSVGENSLTSKGVSWIIVGTLVGGVSTIGTVQTAYTHGVSACIFTFGSGLSCLLLGCFFAKALREEGVITVSEFLGRYFGQRFRYYSSLFNSFGMFVHVVGQFLASIAILQSVFNFGDAASILITLALLSIIVVGGGLTGARFIGQIKFFMLYIIMMISAGLALYKGGGLQHIINQLPQNQNMLGFADYGSKTAVIDICSMLVGVLSTQIYLQAIFSAKNVKEARNGAFISAAIIPPIGIFGIIVGLYLRANFPELEGNAAQALPFFIYHSFPPVIAAFFSAGILLIVLGTGAGLVLGVTTNIYSDFLSRSERIIKDIQPIRLIRLTALTVLILASILVVTGLDSTILRWSYMSMGLRGSAVFTGLFIIVFFKKYCHSRLIRLFLYLIPIFYIVLSRTS